MTKFTMRTYVSKDPDHIITADNPEIEFIDVENTDCSPQVIMKIGALEMYITKKNLAQMVRGFCNKQL